MKWAALALGFAAIAVSPASAHPLRFGHLVVEAEGAAVRVAWTYSAAEAHRRLAPAFVPACLPRGPAHTSLRGTVMERHQRFHCPGGIAGRALDAEALVAAGSDVFVTVREDGVERSLRLGAAQPRSALGARRALTSTFMLGAEHVAGGADHLAFLTLLVLLIGGRRRRLVLVLSAFTFGHAAALVCAAFGALQLAPAPVEACIALSVVFMAREVLVAGGTHSFSRAGRGAWLAIGLGALHGLGFAGTLTDLGIAGEGLLASLVAFNLGVESAQLAFAVVLLLVAGSFERAFPPRGAGLAALAWPLGGLATAWCLDRMLTLGAP